jgi:hypothetical protein
MSQANSRPPSPARIPDNKLRVIHVARRQLGLTEEDYRSILMLFGGVSHSAELDLAGFTAVMERFTALGFASTSPRRPFAQRLGMASPRHTSLIRQLWAECTNDAGTQRELGKWLEGHFGVSSLRFLTGELAPKVIAGLKAMKTKRMAQKAA